MSSTPIDTTVQPPASTYKAPTQFVLPPILQTPRLTLSLFSPTCPEHIAYGTLLFPGLDTLDKFLEYSAQRAPAPWADSAIVYLLRLRPEEARGQNADSVRETVSISTANDNKDEVDDVGNSIMGHVSLAHSLQQRQPRVVASAVSSSSDHAPAYSSAILGTTTVPDVGWRLRPAHEGRGYATEAVTRFLHFLCEDDAGPKFQVVSVFTGENNETRRN